MESELKGRLIGVKSQMESFELHFALHLGARLYSHTDNLVRSVQNKGMPACSGKRLANLTSKHWRPSGMKNGMRTFTRLC